MLYIRLRYYFYHYYFSVFLFLDIWCMRRLTDVCIRPCILCQQCTDDQPLHQSVLLTHYPKTLEIWGYSATWVNFLTDLSPVHTSLRMRYKFFRHKLATPANICCETFAAKSANFYVTNSPQIIRNIWAAFNTCKHPLWNIRCENSHVTRTFALHWHSQEVWTRL